ncbi:hypothetical protein J5X98_08735 [Leptothermofonsia sichuanensis E412]|uniref:hypothetical protein n=1 Tax=Leptothermofonsia sichuanensis TaxID=2917832 RepID=UPI001CA6756E|nr:hypothetical protein [Leptothermofonsia sichuanensis]QZZ22440.1 hypothetical protein J5X98_08735 [Leptothermofonsia sichuanensis E412]
MKRNPSLAFSVVALAALLPSLGAGFAASFDSPREATHPHPRVREMPATYAQRSRTQRIRFKPGESSAMVQTAVIRGTRDTYLLDAQKGQTMTVRIQSLENNAVFDIVTPPNRAGQGRVLKQEAVFWSGQLPDSGDYKVVVGSTRGNASYKLQVTIK